MKTVSIHEAKTHLSRLLQQVLAGETVVIARNQEPIAQIVPFGQVSGERPIGLDRGKLKIASDFNAPLPADFVEPFIS